MEINEQMKEWLNKAAESSKSKINESEVFVSIVSENFNTDPLCALQLGYAILMNKPIYIAVLKGAKVSPALRRFANRIEFVDGDSQEEFQDAIERLIR